MLKTKNNFISISRALVVCGVFSFTATPGVYAVSKTSASIASQSSVVYKTQSAVSTAEGISIRTGAGYNYSWQGSFHLGETITILGTSGSWYKVSYSGITGYVNKQYVKIVAPGTVTYKAQTGVAMGDGISIRTGAGYNYSWQSDFKLGETINILGASGSWYKVSYDGVTGYVNKEYVKIVDKDAAAEAAAEVVAETAVAKAETSKLTADIAAATTAVVAVKDTVKAAAFTARISAINLEVAAEAAAETAVAKAETSKLTADITAATTAVAAVKDTAVAEAFTARISAINGNVGVDVAVSTVSANNATLNGATGISIRPTISVQFTGTPDATKITNSNISIASIAGVAVSTSVSYDATSKIATVTLPSSVALTGNTGYVLTLGTGTGLTTAVTSSFATSNSPVVVSTTPEANKNVGALNNPSVTFNESMDTNTLNTTNVKLYDVTNSKYISINTPTPSNNNKTFTITRADGIAVGNSDNVNYKLIVSSDAKALDGTTIGTDFTLNFADSTVATITPDAINGSTAVYGRMVAQTGKSAFRYVASFNQDMDASTINATTVTLRKVSDNSIVPINVSFDGPSRMATITLPQDLTEYTAYQLTFSTGIKNAAGISSTSATTSNFTTNGWADVNVLSTTPANGASTVDVSGKQTITMTFDKEVANLIGANDANFKTVVGGVANSAEVMLTQSNGTIVPLNGITFVKDSIDPKIVRFTLPDKTLSSDTSYTLSLKGKTTTGANIADTKTLTNTLKDRVDVNFTTATDTKAPAIISAQKTDLNGVAYTSGVTNISNTRTIVFKTNRPLATSIAPANGSAQALSASYYTLRDTTNNVPVDTTTNGHTTIVASTPVGADYSVITMTLKAPGLTTDAKLELTLSGLTDMATPDVNTQAGSYVFDFTVNPVATAIDATAAVGGNVPSDSNSYVFTNDASNDQNYKRGTDTTVTPNGATGVKTNAPIHIGLNEAVTGLDTTNVTLKAGTTNVAGTVAVDTDNKGFTFTPVGKLANDTLYTLTVGTGVKDLVGNAADSDTFVQFRTEVASIDALDIASVTPVAGATNVAVLGAPIKVNFTQKVNVTGTNDLATGANALDSVTPTTTSLKLALKDSNGKLYTGKVSLDSTGKVATITPYGVLPANTTFKILVGGGIASTDTNTTTLYGNDSKLSYVFQTETNASIAPQVASAMYADANGDGYVNKGDVIILKLNTEVTEGNAAETNVMLSGLLKYSLSDGGKFTDGVAADSTAALSTDGKSIVITLGANPIIIPGFTQVGISSTNPIRSNGVSFSSDTITITK